MAMLANKFELNPLKILAGDWTQQSHMAAEGSAIWQLHSE